jgi:hypothetical protein
VARAGVPATRGARGWLSQPLPDVHESLRPVRRRRYRCAYHGNPRARNVTSLKPTDSDWEEADHEAIDVRDDVWLAAGQRGGMPCQRVLAGELEFSFPPAATATATGRDRQRAVRGERYVLQSVQRAERRSMHVDADDRTHPDAALAVVEE